MLFDGLDVYLRDYLYLKQRALVHSLILESVLKSKKYHFFFIELSSRMSYCKRYQCRKVQCVSHRIALPNFSILLSKLVYAMKELDWWACIRSVCKQRGLWREYDKYRNLAYRHLIHYLFNYLATV